MNPLKVGTRTQKKKNIVPDYTYITTLLRCALMLLLLLLLIAAAAAVLLYEFLFYNSNLRMNILINRGFIYVNSYLDFC